MDRYYSVEFSVAGMELSYRFKIWNISSGGLCVVVREDADLLKHIQVGDTLDLRYYTTDIEIPPVYASTSIRHITPDEGRFKGHCLVGLALLEQKGTLQGISRDQRGGVHRFVDPS
jgi:hypothetical protein